MAASVALLVGAHFVLGLGETVIIYILTHWGWHCSFYSSAQGSVSSSASCGSYWCGIRCGNTRS